MQNLPNDELVRLCQRSSPNDTRAFEELVSRYKRRVFSITYRLMGNQQDAEDQAQEAFLKVYRGLHTLEDPAGVTAWISRVTTNTCLDALARRQRQPQTTPLEPMDDAGETEEVRYADTHSPTPEEAALRGEVRSCLERTLMRMESTSRIALTLRDVEDYSYQEIADQLEVGLSAVKMRIHRARQQFQQLLEKVCPGLAASRTATVKAEVSS